MKAFVKTPNIAPRFVDIQPPKIERGMAIVRVLEVGLCRTDLLVASGAIGINEPRILGHEFSAKIVQVCPDSTFKVGQRVAVNPLWGSDFMGLNINGCLVDQLLIPEQQLFALPDSINAKLGAYFEPIAAAMACLKSPLQGRGAIYGRNRIACLTRLILKSFQIDCPILDESEKLEENTFDYLIETMIHPSEFNKLIFALKPGGLLILKSRKTEHVSLPLNAIVFKDITLRGLSYGDWNRVVPWLEQHQELFHSLIGPTFPFEEAPAAFAEANRGEDQKVFIQVNAD